MTLAAPLVLGALLLAGPIVAAYLARRKARKQTVGSLRLLRVAAGKASSKRLIPRLKHPISLLLVLLTLVLLAAGLAGPRCGPVPDGRLMVVLDTGSGMGRTSDAGTSLLDEARGQLGTSLDSAAATRTALVLAGERPRVEVGLTADTLLVDEALGAVTPEGAADLPAALRLADALCVDPQQDAILLVTDGLDAPLPTLRCPVHALTLSPTAGNVGIATLQARGADGLGLIEAVVTLSTDFDEPTPVDVELRLDGVLVDAISTDLEPHGSFTSVRRLDGPGQQLEARIVSDGGSDPGDDVATASLDAASLVRIGLVTDRPDGLLATALKLHPRADVTIVEPDASQSLTDLDLAVLEAPARPPPSGAIVAFGPAIPSLGLQTGEPIQAPAVNRWAFDDRILRYVELDTVVVRQAYPLAVPGSGGALVEAGGHPIAVRGELSGRPLVALGFGVQDSDLALRVDFLHLVANLIDWAAPPPVASQSGTERGLAEIQRGLPTTDLPAMARAGVSGRPWWQWAALAGVGLLILEIGTAMLRPWRRTSTGRKVASWAIRGGVIALLLLSLVSLQFFLPGGRGTVVYVVDRSASVGEAGLAAARERVDALRQTLPGGTPTALVLADGAPVVAVQPGKEFVWPDPLRESAVEASDLGGAVELALGLIDPSAGGRVVLLTDGGDTHGGLPAAGRVAAERGVPVDVVRLPERTGDPALEGLELDAPVVRPGETVRGTATLRGPAGGGGGHLEITVDGEVLFDEVVELAPGRSQATFETPLPDDVRPGPRRLVARLVPAGDDPEPGNNTRSIGLTVGPAPRIMAVTADPREVEGIVRATRAEGMEARIIAPGELTPDDLRDADVLILGDVPVTTKEVGETPLPPEVVEAVRPWVSEGGGLITLGGDRTYELGGWSETSLAAALPLDLEGQAEDLEPGVTLVQILDNSASMGDQSGYQTKMALANEGAVASALLLREQDRLAVLAVNTRVRPVVPFQEPVDSLKISAAIRGIKPGGGGIYTYTALLAAEDIVERSETPLSHVVLYADAQDAEEIVQGNPLGFGPGPNAFDLTRRIRKGGTTVSVIALGDPRDQHVGYLQDIARIGGGRFHITRDAKELRALFVEETREVVRSVVHDGAFRPSPRDPHPSLSGVELASAPPLLGYVEVDARETAEVLLVGPDDKPILAVWQYGLGHVASWSTDLGPRWGRRWLDWPGYSRLVVQQVRWALRPPVARGAGVEATPHPDGLGVVVTRYDEEGLALPDQGLRAVLLDDQGAETPLTLRATTPGRWEGSARMAPGDARTLILEDAATGEEIGRQALVAPPNLEREADASEALLALVDATGGTVDAKETGVPGIGRGRGWDLGWWIALLAVLLLPVDAWVRVPVRG